MLDSTYILNYTGAQINTKLGDKIKKYSISFTISQSSNGSSGNDTPTTVMTIQHIIMEVST